MARSNLNSQAKRKRELAKKDKRAVKDEKRAQRKQDARVARAVAAGEPIPAPSQAASRKTSSSPLVAPKLNASSLAAAAFIRRMKSGSP
jgi:hypothetical protein